MLSLEGLLPLPVLEPGFGFSPWEPQDANPSQDPSDEPDRDLPPAELRKLRRMISNRESARRSRMRKQRHLEGLRVQLSRLLTENPQLVARLGALSQQVAVLRSENERLRANSAALRRRLSELRRFLLARQLQLLASPQPPIAAAHMAHVGFAPGNELATSSIIV